MSALITLNSHEAVASYVEHVLAQHPELKKFARQRQYEALQELLETIFDRYHRESFVIQKAILDKGIDKDIQEELIKDEAPFKIEDIFHCLATLYLHRRMTKESLAGVMKYRFTEPEDLEDFFDYMEYKEFLDVSGIMYINSPVISLTIAEQQELDMFQSNIPMVCKPRKVRLNDKFQKNGYLKIIKSIWSKEADPHNEYVPSDFLDMQNAVKYRINYHVWKAVYQNMPELTKPKRGISKKTGELMTDDEYQKSIDMAELHHWRKDFILTLFEELGIEYIYILNMFDYRLRNYPIAYLFNPQGTDADKCLFGLAPQEITEAGIKWLAISIANCFNCEYQGLDLDKHTFEVRYQWYLETMIPLLEEESLDVFKAKLKIMTLSTELKVESKGCFYAQMHNMWHIIHRNAQVWVITHFDATCSGYQIQAILAGDVEMARLVNLIDPDSRYDMYTVVYLEVLPKLKAAGLDIDLSRYEFKKFCMIPAVYNSVRSIKEMFARALGLPVPKDNFEVLAASLKDERVIAGFNIVNEAMHKYKMWELNRSFPDYWNPLTTSYHFFAPDGAKIYKINKVVEPYSATITGTPVTLKFIEEGTIEYSLELGPNLTHANDGFIARDLARRLKLSKKKKFIKLLMKKKSIWTYTEDAKGSRALMTHLMQIGKDMEYYSARILTELNQHNVDLVPEEIIVGLLKEIPDIYCDVSEIHDSFGVCPNYVEDLMQQYKYSLARLCDSRYLAHVIECLQDTPHGTVHMTKPNRFFKEAILNSKYPLC